MTTASTKLVMPENPKGGDCITFVKKCPYECRRGTHTVVGKWNGKFWDYEDRVRHCKECGFCGETIEVRPYKFGDTVDRDLRIATIGQLLDSAKDAARDGKTSYIKCIQAFIPKGLKADM